MKLLSILRHAKSSWSDSSLPDHDRPLNKRGFRDAPRMGELIREKGLVPNAILSSTALRARETALAVAAATEFPDDNIDNNCNGKNDCFIATASFGTGMTGKIDVLRDFRDQCLLTSGPGKALVDAYYRLSPDLAEVIAERNWLKFLVRTALLPMIGVLSMFL